MKDIKTRTKILMSLGILFIIMGVGYAILSTTLNINGTTGILSEWNVYISDITEKTLGNATTVFTKVDSKTTASFSVNLEKPGSYAEYEVTVKNDGNLNAVLKGINGIDETNAIEPTDVEYSVKDLTEDTPLEIGEEIKFIIRVDFKSSATTLPTTSTKSLTFSLDFEQSTGGTITPTVEPTKEPTPESCFEASNGEITGYLCTETDVVISDTINGEKITKIGDNVFEEKGLTNVTIPNSVTSIGEWAFEDNQLTSVTIPNKITEIKLSAFGNNQLSTIEIPNSLTKIDDFAFASNRLTSVTIPSSVTTIGWSAFMRNQLTIVTIPSSVASIGDDAFSENPNLVKIVNLTGKAFDWNGILGNERGTSAVTGTYGNVTVTDK